VRGEVRAGGRGPGDGATAGRWAEGRPERRAGEEGASVRGRGRDVRALQGREAGARARGRSRAFGRGCPGAPRAAGAGSDGRAGEGRVPDRDDRVRSVWERLARVEWREGARDAGGRGGGAVRCGRDWEPGRPTWGETGDADDPTESEARGRAAGRRAVHRPGVPVDQVPRGASSGSAARGRDARSGPHGDALLGAPPRGAQRIAHHRGTRFDRPDVPARGRIELRGGDSGREGRERRDALVWRLEEDGVHRQRGPDGGGSREAPRGGGIGDGAGEGACGDTGPDAEGRGGHVWDDPESTIRFRGLDSRSRVGRHSTRRARPTWGRQSSTHVGTAELDPRGDGRARPTLGWTGRRRPALRLLSRPRKRN